MPTDFFRSPFTCVPQSILAEELKQLEERARAINLSLLADCHEGRREAEPSQSVALGLYAGDRHDRRPAFSGTVAGARARGRRSGRISQVAPAQARVGIIFRPKTQFFGDILRRGARSRSASRAPRGNAVSRIGCATLPSRSRLTCGRSSRRVRAPVTKPHREPSLVTSPRACGRTTARCYRARSPASKTTSRPASPTCGFR